MQSPGQPLDFNIMLGSSSDYELLAKIRLDLVIGEEVSTMRQSRKLPATAEDVIFCIDFSVQVGRQKEFSQYVEKGIDGDQKHLSPLQQLFFRPKSAGKVQILEFPGMVRVMYKFYSEYLQDLRQLFEQIEKQSEFKPVLNTSLQLRGKVTHHKKNRTAAKVQYAKVQGHASLNLKSILNVYKGILESNGESSQEINMYLEHPLFQTALKMRKIKMNVGLESFRKLRRLYKKATQQEDIELTKKTSFPYVTKGLIKENVTYSLFYKDRYALEGSIVYHSQDIFMRLLKVYSKFIAKIFDLAHKLEQGQWSEVSESKSAHSQAMEQKTDDLDPNIDGRSMGKKGRPMTASQRAAKPKRSSRRQRKKQQHPDQQDSEHLKAPVRKQRTRKEKEPRKASQDDQVEQDLPQEQMDQKSKDRSRRKRQKQKDTSAVKKNFKKHKQQMDEQNSSIKKMRYHRSRRSKDVKEEQSAHQNLPPIQLQVPQKQEQVDQLQVDQEDASISSSARLEEEQKTPVCRSDEES